MLLRKLDALFLWITLVLANLSNMEDTFGIKDETSLESLLPRNLRNALRMVLW